LAPSRIACFMDFPGCFERYVRRNEIHGLPAILCFSYYP
jgi:hypothetical protein